MNEIIYGIHTVRGVLENSPKSLRKVFILGEYKKNKRLFLLNRDLWYQGIAVQLVSRNFLNKKSNNAVHQGIVAYIKTVKQQKYKENNLSDLIKELDNPFLLILDNITDPHNLGACLRSASAAGVHAVIIPRDRSAQLNDVARKVACGAAENMLLIRVTNLVRTIHFLKKMNIWIFGTTKDATQTLYQSNMTGRIALVMGSENNGIRSLTRKHCDELIRIPMINNNDTTSLNVSVATGVCLFEVIRQRKFLF